MPKSRPVATPDIHIPLDTQAFGRARRRRTTLRATYWLLLVAAAASVAAILTTAAARTDRGADGARAVVRPAPVRKAATTPAVKKQRRVVPPPGLRVTGTAPAPARTPVAVWNGFGGKGAASGTAAELARLGYPTPTVGNAPALGYRRTLVLYAPGQAAAAVALARRLNLPRAAVGPLDGVRPAAIKPARLLVILGG